MCLYLFGSCDANNQLHQVSQVDCVRLRDDVCAGPWEAISKARGGALPDCSAFEDQKIQCLGKQLSVMSLAHSQFSFQCNPFITDTNGTLFTNSSEDVTLVPTSQIIECDEGFYLHNESICRHLCSSWVDPPGIDPDTVVIIASLINAVVSSAIVIIVTLTLLRKEM